MNLRNKSSGPPSQDRFATMVIDSIRQVGEKGKIIYDREQFCLHGEGEMETRLRLGEPYRRFCGASEEMRAELLRTLAQHWSVSKKATPVEYEDAKSDLLPVMAMQVNETGHFASYCDWSKNVVSLLPRTDLIAFVRDGKDPFMATWDRVVEVMGDSMTPLDIYPQRFQVSEFPTDEQLAAMGARTP
jgi:hypothetical protein